MKDSGRRLKRLWRDSWNRLKDLEIELLFPSWISSSKMQSCEQLTYYVKHGDCTVNIAIKWELKPLKAFVFSLLWRNTRLLLTYTAIITMTQSCVATALLWLHRKSNQFGVWIKITRRAENFCCKRQCNTLFKKESPNSRKSKKYTGRAVINQHSLILKH